MATLADRDTTGTLQAGEGEMELVGRRTRRAKVFHRVGTRQYRIGASLGPVHYRRDPFDEWEELKEIDLSLDPTPGEEWDFACETNGYQVRIWNSREVGGRTLWCAAQFRRAGRWFEMAPVTLLWMNGAGERELIAKPVASAPTIEQEPDRVLWRDAFGAGLDFCYTLTPDHFWKAVIVREKAALPRPTIGLAGLRLVVVMAIAWEGGARAGNGFAAAVETTLGDDAKALDAADEELREPGEFDYRDTADRPLWWLRKPRAWDSGEERQAFEMEWGLRRRGGVVLMLLGIEARALADEAVVYPVYIDTSIAEEQVGASDDDGHIDGGAYPGSTSQYLDTSYSTIGASTLKYYMGGWRFQTVPIPNGATIDSATLSLRCRTTREYTSGWRCGAEDVDDAAVWSAGHTIKNGWVVRTTAYTDWNVGPWTAGTWYVTPSLAAAIEEVVARGGWSSGNNINLMVWYRTESFPPTNEYENASQWDENPSYGAKFNCTYTEAAPAGGDWLFAND